MLLAGRAFDDAITGSGRTKRKGDDLPLSSLPCVGFSLVYGLVEPVAIA